MGRKVKGTEICSAVPPRKQHKNCTFLALGIRKHRKYLTCFLIWACENTVNSVRSLFWAYENTVNSVLALFWTYENTANTLLSLIWALEDTRSKPLCARNHCSSLLRRLLLEISARACFEAPLHSKSLLELASFSLEVAEATAQACLEAIMGSKSLLELAYVSLEVAEATARACFKAIMGSRTLFELASKQPCTHHCSTLVIFRSRSSKPRLTYPSGSLLEKTARVDYTASNCTLYDFTSGKVQIIKICSAFRK